MNGLEMVINVSHSSDETISHAIDAMPIPFIATHHGMRSLVDIPRNMPDWLLKKLAGWGGFIGFQIGNEFHSPVEYAYQTKHAHKAFWDTSGIAQQVAGLSIERVDKLIAPEFPRVEWQCRIRSESQ
jgi:membrane dipeptidase